MEINTELKPIGINSFSVADILPKVLSASVSQVDLVFASNSELRAIAEVYACDENQQKFIDDFVVSNQRSSEFSIYTSLLSTYIENGKTIKKHPELIYSRGHHIEQFAKLSNTHKSIIQPSTYPVTMSL